VVILPDNDEPGRKHAQQVAATLQGIAASVKIVDLPDLPPKGDVSNWIAAGGTAKKLFSLVEHTAEWTQGTYRKSKEEGISKPSGTYRKFKEGDVPTALAKLKALYRKSYYFSDDTVIDLVLGIVAGNHFDSDPIWLHLISPPSGGKTELLYSIFECDETYFLSDFTPAALISGYRDPPEEGQSHARD
jgi:hypothetical protein